MKYLYAEFFFCSSNSSTASTAMRKLAVSLADSPDLRVILSVIYIVVEVMRNIQDDDTDHWKNTCEIFRNDICKFFDVS